ncbi:MAG: hypothetical protein IJZ68_06220 [Bacteroidaceae bacterium]|nr:hypothetical protein [Bacteroidaceae bacterium]
MKKLITIIAVMAVLLTGCAQEKPAGDKFVNPPTNITETPPETSEKPTTPETTQPDSTETQPTESPTAPSTPSEPYVTTAEDIKAKMNGEFEFGDSVLYTPVYVYYPSTGIVEMQFEYEGLHYYARAYKGHADIACWNHNWLKPYGTCEELEGLSGDFRRATKDDVVYTSIIWYDTAKDLTYTLDWTGGREDYFHIVAVTFNFVDESPYVGFFEEE